MTYPLVHIRQKKKIVLKIAAESASVNEPFVVLIAVTYLTASFRF